MPTNTNDDSSIATLPATTAPATTAPAPPARQKVPVRMGLAPQTLEEGFRLADMFSQSDLVPKNFRGHPADVMVAIQLGMELGLAPMQAMQSIAVVNGRPSVWGDGFLALIVASPKYRDHEEFYEVDGQRRDGLTAEDLKKGTTAAVCTFWRSDKERPTTARFTIAQALKAGLIGKEGTWQSYPDRMLKMRARSWAGRDAFPDVLRGLKTTEEVLDTPDDAIDISPARVEPVQPRRASEARTQPAASDSGAAVGPDPLGASAPNAADSGTTATSQRSPAAASSASSSPERFTTHALKVVKTEFAKPQKGEPFFRIGLVNTKGDLRRFVTRDEQAYKEAASFEGTDHLVIVEWHRDGGADEHDGVLDAIDIDDAAETTLFR